MLRCCVEFKIDPESGVPIYLQIVQSIKNQVATGRLKPGEQLPTVRELASNMRINPNTVGRAYDLLDADSVITTQQGRGTFVRERPDQRHLARVHHDRLNSMIHDVLGNALSMGYTQAEIHQAFETQLARWSNAAKD